MSNQDIFDRIDELEDPEEIRRTQAQQLIDLEQVIPGVSPGAVLDAMDDPEAFAAIARGDLYVQLAVMRQRMAHPKISMGQRLDYAKFLAKMGRVDAPVNDGVGVEGLPMISILFPSGAAGVQITAAHPREREVNDKHLTDKAVLP